MRCETGFLLSLSDATQQKHMYTVYVYYTKLITPAGTPHSDEERKKIRIVHFVVLILLSQVHRTRFKPSSFL